jgi:hypothetical protein
MDLNLEDKSANTIIKRLNSPRTLEAMAILGFVALELEAITMEEVKHYFQKRERN